MITIPVWSVVIFGNPAIIIGFIWLARQIRKEDQNLSISAPFVIKKLIG